MGNPGGELGDGVPCGVDGWDGGEFGADGLAWPWEVADGLAWPWRGADGLAFGDGGALDGVELGEEVLEHSPLRKEVIFEPAIA